MSSQFTSYNLQMVTLGTPLEWGTLLYYLLLQMGTLGTPLEWGTLRNYLLLQMGTLGTPLEWDTLLLLSIITDGNPENPPGEGKTTITIYYYR